MNTRVKRYLPHMKINTRSYIEEFVKIRNKDSQIIPFILNQPQLKLYEVIKKQTEENKPVRIIILKARQMGFSTVTGGIILKNAATKSNIQAGIVAHKEDSSTNLFNMYKLMYDNLPPQVKPTKKASNAKELIFNNAAGTGLNSSIRCMTAGAKGIGRSFTMNYLHISELAFWEGDPADTLLGLFQAVPNKPGTMIIIESTANGYEEFKNRWDQAVNGESDFYPLFVGWNELDEYKMPYDGFELTDYERELKKQYNLTYDQLTWRRWCIKNNCGGDVDKFKQEYPISPDEAFLSTGRCVFDQEKIIDRLSRIKPPIERGEFTYNYDGLKLSGIRLAPTSNGPIRIYNKPEPGEYYVIGADTAGEGSDYFYAHVINNSTGKHAAVYRLDTDETLFARQMYALGKYYNNALLAIESNFSTYPIKELERLGYENLFVREREDSYTGGIIKSFGFRTTSLTRPILIALVSDVIRENIDLIDDDILLREALTFVRNEKGRAEAMEGKHDDGVMSYGIALYARGQQKVNVPKNAEKKKLFKWSEDLKQDYYKADKKTRERMIEKYGEPN